MAKKTKVFRALHNSDWTELEKKQSDYDIIIVICHSDAMKTESDMYDTQSYRDRHTDRDSEEDLQIWIDSLKIVCVCIQ